MSIKVDKVDVYDDVLPISVIIPLDKKRRDFFEKFVLPLIEANNPAEIIINDNEGGAPKKRNDGYSKSTQPYIYFCDDDILLPSDHLEKLYTKLKEAEKDKNNTYGYAYSGYKGIVLHPETHPMRGNFDISTVNFNPRALKKSNFISTMALINKKYFPMFDESLKRFQDWDIWLTMLRKNVMGVAVHNNEFFAYYLDQGITSNNNNQREALMKIMQKHKIGTW